MTVSAIFQTNHGNCFRDPTNTRATVWKRPSFWWSPSISRSLDTALDLSSLQTSDIDLFDFYSSVQSFFASTVFLLTQFASADVSPSSPNSRVAISASRSSSTTNPSRSSAA